MKIIVTGGMGFIGHNIVAKLQDEHEVIIIDNHTNYGFIPTKEIDYLIGERRKKISNYINYPIDIVQGDNINVVFDRFKPDLVIHCASFPRQKALEANPGTGARVMCEGLTNLLEASTRNNAKRFVYISSSMVYGDFEHDVTEDAVCTPMGQYAIFKYMGEKLVQDYTRRTGIEYTIIRPSAVYGEFDVEDRVVSKFLLNSLRSIPTVINGPEEVLDFTYVDDVVKGIIQASMSDKAVNQIYNLTRSNSELYTLHKAALLAAECTGVITHLQMSIRDPKFPKRGRLCIDKASRDFGYNPTTNISDGFKRYSDWLKSSSYYIGNK
jgi:nucleoside-diphosphate-sugar epimerase